MLRLVVNDVKQMQQLAQVISKHLQGGDLVVLTGDLGAGKTVFARSLLQALGVDQTVTSPTFVIMKNYRGKFPIEHVDIYRIDSLEELDVLGIPDLLEEGHLVVMEWGEKALGVFSESFLHITFERLEDDVSLEDEIAGQASRFISLDIVGPGFTGRRNQLENDITGHWGVAI